MGYFGCGAMIQFAAIALVSVAIFCSISAWYADVRWTRELERIKVIFTDEEVELLQRNGQIWDIPYLLTLVFIYFLAMVHTFLCFHKQHSRFHKSKISLFITVLIGLGLIGISVCPVITAWIYDANYFQIQHNDRRAYSYQQESFNGSISLVKTNSIFHYCHFGNGRPISWSKLKGIRMKKFGSDICQKVGLRYISAFLTAYAGVIYMLTLKVLDSRHRDKSAAHIALLFDLFGDLEEATAEQAATIDKDGEEHFGLQMDMQKYKRELLRNTYKKTKLPLKLEEWLKTGKYEEEDEDTFDRRIIEPNRYHVSPYLEENVERGVPSYLTKVMETKLEIANEAEAKENAKKEAQDAMEQKREEWLEERKRLMRAKRMQYAQNQHN